MDQRSAMMMVNSKEGGDDDDALIGLPPGFRFHPTDEEIVTHYLTPKVRNRTFSSVAIGEADLNKSEPWDLPKKAKMGEKEWWFFCQRDRKYPTGMRTNRATESGYWKATGKDREIFRNKLLVGMKKTLVFYKGRAPRGEKTNWVMHEFRLEGKFSYYSMPKPSQEEWVVCRVFHKTSGAQKSPIADHGLNSYVDDLLDSPSLLPPLVDPSTKNLDPTFASDPISYFSHTRPEILQENQDYKNILISSYNYNFNTNNYQANSSNQYVGKNPPYLSSTSTLYWSDTVCKKEKDHDLILSEKMSVSQDTGVSNEITANTETSSTSMLSKDGLRQREYDPDDHVCPSAFPELDALLEY